MAKITIEYNPNTGEIEFSDFKSFKDTKKLLERALRELDTRRHWWIVHRSFVRILKNEKRRIEKMCKEILKEDVSK